MLVVQFMRIINREFFFAGRKHETDFAANTPRIDELLPICGAGTFTPFLVEINLFQIQ